MPRLREPKKGIFKKFVNLDTFIGSSVTDPDPDPHVFGPPGSGSIHLIIGSGFFYLLSSCKNSKKNLDSFYFVTLFDFFIFEK